ncbi:MAG: ribosomal RNA small subunit methyltransferase A, partial [Acidobacteria bacterium]|nr:ribosomal RNA small subunit methyltransferase A [Acidobacteriota bacterium]
PGLAADLRHRFADRPQVHVLEADILQLSLPELAREHGVTHWRVYGNLPYYITSPILHWLFDAIAVVADIHVVAQREVAQRLAAPPGRRDYGYLSVVTQFHTRPQILAAIPRGAFRPPPQVESALVRLVPPGEQAALRISQPQEFLRFVAACFRQKRRTLRSNLRAAYGAAAVEEALAQMALAPRARAEELSLRALAQLYHRLTPRPGVVVRSEGV